MCCLSVCRSHRTHCPASGCGRQCPVAETGTEPRAPHRSRSLKPPASTPVLTSFTPILIVAQAKIWYIIADRCLSSPSCKAFSQLSTLPCTTLLRLAPQCKRCLRSHSVLLCPGPPTDHASIAIDLGIPVDARVLVMLLHNTRVLPILPHRGVHLPKHNTLLSALP